jgi:hypothetical protein
MVLIGTTKFYKGKKFKKGKRVNAIKSSLAIQDLHHKVDVFQ